MLEQLTGLNISRELIVVFISMLPIFELRGALPVGINLFGMPWPWVLTLAIIGNMLPIPFILLFLDSGAKLISRVRPGKRLVDWLFERTRRRSEVVQRYERVGLALFVAVPLPLTGAWTGALAAFLFGLKFSHALLSILAGVIIAGVIVTALSLLGWVGAAVAGVGLAALAAFGLWKA